MIEEHDLQALVDYDGDGQVLSAYSDTNLAHQQKESVILHLKEQVKPFEEVAATEIEAVNRFLNFEYDWQSRGVAVFASGDTYWQTLSLRERSVTQAHYGKRPTVRPLVDVLDRLGQYAVAVMDRQNVRLFSVAWGRITGESESVGEEIKRHKQGGWAAARYQRREDNLAMHNLKGAVEAIQAFCEKNDCQRLVLGGSQDVLAQVKEMLPHSLRERVTGEFNIDVQATPAEILDRSLDVATQSDWEEEQRLVSDVITAAASGGAGVIGLADTLSMLHQGRVRLLLIDEALHTPGWVCPQCGYVSTEQGGSCPLCQYDAIEETSDVVDVAIYKALQTNTEINVIRQNPEFTAAGGIGALLRY